MLCVRINSVRIKARTSSSFAQLLTTVMPNDPDPQPSKATLKYYPKADKKCKHCEELSVKVQSLQDTIDLQNNSVIEILAEHKVLLSKIVSQNNVLDDIMQIFPIKSEDKLSELNVLIQSQADPYLRRMKSLLKGNVGRYLNEILGQNIIHDFNVDGTHGKHFYSALIDAIAVFSEEPDTMLRKAFQLRKKKTFLNPIVWKN